MHFLHCRPRPPLMQLRGSVLQEPIGLEPHLYGKRPVRLCLAFLDTRNETVTPKSCALPIRSFLTIFF